MATENIENGKSAALLSKYHAEWVASGSKAPTKVEETRLAKAWQTARKARDAAEAAFRAAVRAESDTVANIIRAKGKGRFNMNGTNYMPMSRGETCYLRGEGEPAQAFG
jgi:hypothetical protein